MKADGSIECLPTQDRGSIYKLRAETKGVPSTEIVREAPTRGKPAIIGPSSELIDRSRLPPDFIPLKCPLCGKEHDFGIVRIFNDDYSSVEKEILVCDFLPKRKLVVKAKNRAKE